MGAATAVAEEQSVIEEDVENPAPSDACLKNYARALTSAARVCTAVCAGGQLPVPESDRAIDLELERNIDNLRRFMLERVREEFGAKGIDFEEWEQRIATNRGQYVRYADFENDFDAAAALLSSSIMSVNMLARLFYERYPSYRPLYLLILRLTEPCPKALRKIFGDELPEDLRKSWPHFTGLFELIR